MKSQEKASLRPEHPTLSSGLLNGARQMDAESWSRLVNTFAPVVYSWCRNSGVAEADTADIVQLVFVSVARGIRTFERRKEVGSFRSWLATITRSRVRDHFRRLSKQEIPVGGTDAWQSLQQTPAPSDEELATNVCVASSDGIVESQVVNSVRAEFEPRTWMAFWLTAVDGKAAAEVAESLRMSRSNVYQSKSRILRRLRERLSQLPE